MNIDGEICAEVRPVDGNARRRELSAFLRSRRERLRPEDLGLATGPRRRTPGLRREEVAELAGIGVTWYTWLEQGRDIRVSQDVIDAVARTLRLDADERDHLYALSGLDETPHRHEGVRPGPVVQRILDALEPCPALVVSSRYDLLAWNRPAAALFADFGSLPACDRNMLWLSFTDPAWRTLLVDYEADTARMVARFRGSMGRHVGESGWTKLVDRLIAASPRFAEVWERHEVSGVTSRTKRFVHPAVGPLRLDHTPLQVAEIPECEIRVYTPADEATRAALPLLLQLGSHMRPAEAHAPVLAAAS